MNEKEKLNSKKENKKKLTKKVCCVLAKKLEFTMENIFMKINMNKLNFFWV